MIREFLLPVWCATWVSVFTTAVTAHVYINELMASNGSSSIDTASGTFPDWIEIHNDSTLDVEIGNYFLSDKPDNPAKWRIPVNTIIPAGGYVVIWADGSNTALHTNFSLSADGECIVLVRPDLLLADSITFGPQVADRSYGRNPAQPDFWSYFDFPTPGAPNSRKTLSAHAKTAEVPRFSRQGGFYQQVFDLTITSGQPGDTLRYTTDGAEPTRQSRVYEKPVSITGTTVIRAKTFSESLYNSPTVTATYFIGSRHTLPVIALATDPNYLWDSRIGIYTKGTNGSVGFFGDTANYYRDWERPVNVELFASDQRPGFNERAGVEIVGLTSRTDSLKGMAIGFGKKYGKSEVEYRLFPSRKTSRLKEFVLRNSGGYDLLFTHFRDGMMNNLVANRMNIDYQAYQPAVIYLNGSYWGILNMREKINKNYPAVIHNADPDNIDFLEFFKSVIVCDGDSDHYDELVQYVSNNTLTTEDAYNYINAKIDLQEFINYHIAEIYFQNTDWPGNNVKMWRPKHERGKWRWILTDVEIGFNLFQTPPEQDGIRRLLEPVEEGWNFPWATLLFRKLIENKRIRQQFIQTFACYLSTVFDSSSVLRQIDSTQNLLKPEFPAHISRWHHIASMDQWNKNVDTLREFARKRPLFCLQHLKNNFMLQDAIPVTFITAPAGLGRIELNGQVLPSDTFSCALFREVPIDIKAVPNTGYTFIGWRRDLVATSDSVSCTIEGKNVIMAEFARNANEIIPAVISSDAYLNKAGSPYFAGRDVRVDSNATLTVDPGVTIYCGDSVSFIIHGALELNGTENDPVIFKPDSSSRAESIGALCFLNTTIPSRLSHVRIRSASKSKADPDGCFASITVLQSAVQLNDVYLESTHQPFYAENSDVTISASAFRSNATCDLIHVKGGSVVVENCDLKGNYSFDTDAIDFDGVDGGVIRGNRIYDINGDNSDAIDLGEGSKNILIQDNLIRSCSDKGVSVGQASTATIERTTILFCGLGVGVKDAGSIAYLDRNTFHGNRIAVACFEKNAGAGGGRAEVKNCIFSASEAAPATVDQYSELVISYSLSTTSALGGIGNISGQPRFVAPVSGDFNLEPNSICIDAGDPSSPKDPDHTIADLGSHSRSRQVSINEICYLGTGQPYPGDWIELVNTGSDAVDCGRWSIVSRKNGWRVQLSPLQLLPPNSYRVVPGNYRRFHEQNSECKLIAGETSFDLDSSDEILLLLNAAGTVMDSVHYTDGTPWPVMTGTGNSTLALANSQSDNAYPGNWFVGRSGGTPGKSNATATRTKDIVINEINYNADPLFDTEDWIELYNRGDTPLDISGWVMTDDDTDHRYTFPVATIIASHDFIVVCRNRGKFSLFHPKVWNTIGDYDFGLGSNGDRICLFDAVGNCADSLSYRVTAPWPAEPNGTGTTLELINPDLENALATSWANSDAYGTPGRINSRYASTGNVSGGRSSLPARTRLLYCRQSAFTHTTEITCTISQRDSGAVCVSAYNLRGQLIETILDKRLPAGLHRCTFHTERLSRGTFLIRFATRNAIITRTLILVR